MKLIIKEYLASLKERDGLDAVLPDLLSQGGLNVFSRPSKGVAQYGVDVAAFGRLEDKQEEAVYLLSIKTGSIDHRAWNGGDQALYPSICQIVNVYIPCHLPNEYSGKKIKICLCFGGDLKEQVRLEINSTQKAFEDKNPNIEFLHWNGDKLADMILSSFLHENLFVTNSLTQSYLRKSLAMLDEPQVSYQFFQRLIYSLININDCEDSERVTSIRQVNICLWILFAWSITAGNLESAYLSSEFSLLFAWNIVKKYTDKKTKISISLRNTFQSILNVYLQICLKFLDKVMIHIPNMHAVTSAIRSPSKVDVNLKIFDFLGRIAMQGIWVHHSIKNESDGSDNHNLLIKQSEAIANMLKHLIINNPALNLPLKDDQAIDISIAILFFMYNTENFIFIKSWLNEIINRAIFSYKNSCDYPCIINSYEDLLKHPKRYDDVYREEVTSGSILYPMISFFAVILGDTELYEKIKLFKKTELGHCNFQFWFLDETSEQHFYINSEMHGITLSDVGVHLPSEDFIIQIIKECEINSSFEKMTAVEHSLWPIILVGCRHYRLPLPLHLFKNFKETLE